MSRFTKATLLISGLILAAAAETALVSGLFSERGGFFIGGEWFLPAVGVAVWVLMKQVGNCLKTLAKSDE